MAFLEIDGRSVAYRDVGSQTAPLVILAHPLGMTQAVWDDTVAVLTGRYRVITWDLPGHGASAPRVGEIRAEQLAAEALTLADQAGAQRFRFVGTSIGGVIGQQLLIQAPERLGRVVLTNTGAVIGTPDNWHARARRVREEGVAALVDEIVPRWFSQASRNASPALEAGWKTVLARTDDESYARLCELLATTDYRDKLLSVSIGVHLLGGSEDLSTPPETLQGLEAELADSELEILDGVAHVPSVDCPDIINQRLVNWLADG
ncbi:3-oxoadipate enol-lactonase [Modicisalibacter muralis]|uniref:3-oxoadipate enol-lactonase n=1 Tax=Modicisalibacter muralis TaxID=119000 RepID=A0A1G9JJI8_9GAMM|nr:alpha/beta fold hydrolase [Halomonas muralis]SDL37254.1 3-oxoadipate enol-lactonase [Halomonas muralis]